MYGLNFLIPISELGEALKFNYLGAKVQVQVQVDYTVLRLRRFNLNLNLNINQGRSTREPSAVTREPYLYLRPDLATIPPHLRFPLGEPP